MHGCRSKKLSARRCLAEDQRLCCSIRNATYIGSHHHTYLLANHLPHILISDFDFIAMSIFSWASLRYWHLIAYLMNIFICHFAGAATLPSFFETNPGPSINALGDRLPSSIVGLRCLSDSVLPHYLEWSKCYAIIDEMKLSREYSTQKSTWRSASGEEAKYIWGSRSKVGCVIGVSARRSGLIGHFSLLDVFPAFKKLMVDCPYQSGIAYFRTDGLGKDYEDGWAVTFFAPFITTDIAR